MKPGYDRITLTPPRFAKEVRVTKQGKLPEERMITVIGTCAHCHAEVECDVPEVDAKHSVVACPTSDCNNIIQLHLPTLTRTIAPEQRWTKGVGTWDGQRCEQWNNVTNWP